MAFVVAVLAASLVATAPVSAQPDESLPRSWVAFGERVVDWVSGLWRIAAGSETGDPATTTDTDGTDSAELDGSGDATSTDDPTTQTEAFPGYDPDG